MASITLSSPDIALLSDIAGSRLTLPSLSEQQRSVTFGQATVFFDGYTDPITYRDATRQSEWNLSVLYTPSEQADAVALMNLFDEAHLTAADGRLYLRTNGALVAGLSVAEVVTVDSYTPVMVRTAAVRVDFHAVRAHFTEEV